MMDHRFLVLWERMLLLGEEESSVLTAEIGIANKSMTVWMLYLAL